MTGIFGTQASLFSDVSFILEIAITLLFTIGYFYQRGKEKHCAIMGGAVIVNIIFVISYMLSRLLSEGVPPPPSQFATIYRGITIIHGVLSVLVLFSAISQAFLAYKWRIKKNDIIMLGRKRSTHRKLGLLTLVSWYISFLTGIIIYILLYIL